MAFIYVITNDVNGKQYVGKTVRNIQDRFQEHIIDRKNRTRENRPLYRAMNKYGVEHFSIQLLEECSLESSSEREQYWIQKLKTYHDGYNATVGGDGTPIYNYQELAAAYLKYGTVKEAAQKMGCNIDTIRHACRSLNVQIDLQPECKKKTYKQVKILPDGKTFSSLMEAARYLSDNGYTKSSCIKGIATHIREACLSSEKRYQHYWRFV